MTQLIIEPTQRPLAPWLHLRSKVREGVCDDARLIARAVQAARGIDVPVPLVSGARVLGLTLGSPMGDPTVRWLPWGRYWCGFATFDDLISELGSGKGWNALWSKAASTAGVANNWYDLWPVTGDPASGAYGGAALTAVVPDDTAQGAIWHGGNVSTDTKHVIKGFVNSTITGGLVLLYDRLVEYDACPFSAGVQQTMTNTATMSRYSGTGLSGGRICVTCQTVMNSTAGNITEMTYVDQAGTTGKLVPQTAVPAWIVSAAAPTATLGARVVCPATTSATVPWSPFMPMQAGSPGARSITSYTPSAANTGTLCIVLMRVLAWFAMPSTANISSSFEFVTQMPSLERIYDGACLSCLSLHGTTGPTLSGSFDVAWG